MPACGMAKSPCTLEPLQDAGMGSAHTDLRFYQQAL
jgi:hypothetical protein